MSAQDIVVLIETQGEGLADISLELLAAARAAAAGTGGQTVAVLLGQDGSRYAPQLSAADRILVINDPQLAAYAPEPYTAVLQAVVAAEAPRAVLIGSTSIGWDLAPALAAKLNAPMVVGCRAIAVQGTALAVTSTFCGGKLTADVEVTGSPAVLMVMPGSFRPTAEAGKAQVEVRPSPVAVTPGAITFEKMILPEAGDVDITQQDVLVAVGRGIQQKDNVELAEELAQRLGGAVCASRPVVDQGWLPPTRQVGKSGMTVKPKLYLALGISGAPEHQEGMKGADLIIAVNTDPKAPIFDVAHYGAEVDALELLPALIEAVGAGK